MPLEKFMEDLQKIYNELQDRQQKLNDYYKILDDEHPEAEKLVKSFLSELQLPVNDETIMAGLTRLVNLREDSLEQVLSKEGLSEEEIIEKKEKAYIFVRDMHLLRHEYFIAWIKSENLLTPFYRTLMEGVHNIGESISRWQSSWTADIINGINRELLEKYNGSEKDILEMLQDKELLDLDPNGVAGDRCYSVLKKDAGGEYRSVSYCDAFPNEVADLVSVIEDCIEALSLEDDEVFGQKDDWIRYLVSIKKAFSIREPKKLIGYWANVDRAWMKIKTPIQVGHPLEYYEDHFRKAVALEWDMRMINPKLQKGSLTRENIKKFSKNMSEELGENARLIIEDNHRQIDRTQLYIGQPMLYYGAEFNGLFSAQVVPNDEQVSNELGKKIFAYTDFIMESEKSKPIMKLSVEFFGLEFINKRKKLLMDKPSLWYELYDIMTIGHEFGHILWMDIDTETIMNTSGQFKNIEEFKATVGGLMAFFENEKEELKEYVVDELVTRSIKLIAWQEVGDVLPYYCEGLIHLKILFDAKLLSYEGKQIKIDYKRYDEMKLGYMEAYKSIVNNYIKKVNANLYLSKYVQKKGEIYLPTDEKIADFVKKYYDRYKEIGQQSYKLKERKKDELFEIA